MVLTDGRLEERDEGGEDNDKGGAHNDGPVDFVSDASYYYDSAVHGFGWRVWPSGRRMVRCALQPLRDDVDYRHIAGRCTIECSTCGVLYWKEEAKRARASRKLKPFVGEVPDNCTSCFMATWQMYFPFLTCEVKCGNLALDIADRQNAHSMTLAIRGIVELFRMVKREKELHLQILAFSVSHDHRTVRIYGHYPLIDRDKTEFYRHPIYDISFTLSNEKWAAYRFTKNVYDI
jgi:hypothetical protein